MELEERIKRILNSPELELDGNAYEGKYELNRASIKRFILEKLRINKTNLDTGNKISLNRTSAKELVKHNLSNEAYSKSIAHIPIITENMKFLEEMAPEESKAKFENYSYYITGINMDNKPYTIISVVGRMGREIYYDQNVFEGTKQEVFNKAINATDDNKYSRLSKILKKAVNDGLESQTQTH